MFTDNTGNHYKAAKLGAYKAGDWVGNDDYEAGLKFYTITNTVGFQNTYAEKLRIISEGGSVFNGVKGATGANSMPFSDGYSALEARAPEGTTQFTVTNTTYEDTTFNNEAGIWFKGNYSGNNERAKSAIIHANSADYGVGSLNFCVDGGANNDNAVLADAKARIPAATWGLLVTNIGSTGDTGGYQTDGVSLRYDADSTFCVDGGAAVTFTRKSNAGKVIDFYNNTNYAGGVYVNGANSADYQSSSDYRLKDNVNTMSDGITKIKQLNPIYYTNKQIEGVTDTTTVYTGFLAHEVESVIPTLVDGEKDAPIDEKGKGYQTLSYGRFTPTAIAAIKELIAKVETLEAEVAALKSS